MEAAEEEVEQQAAILAQEGVEMDDDMAYALRLEKGLFTLQQVKFSNTLIDTYSVTRLTTLSSSFTDLESSPCASVSFPIFQCASRR